MTIKPIVMRRGFSVNVFLPSGDPEGLKVIEKSNWTGHGLVIPRSMFGESKTRNELERTGLYLLIGPGESHAWPKLYVGQGEIVKQRLQKHHKDKDFWTHAVIFTSKDANLNKAHVQRLESRLVGLAKAAKQCVLENGNEPSLPSLSESDEAMVEGFLDDILLCLPILGYRMFEMAALSLSRNDKPSFMISTKGIVAHGYDAPSGFIVFEKSQAVGESKLTPSLNKHYPYVKEQRDELIRQGVLVQSGEDYVFTMDYPFSSPSMASTIVAGRVSNGRTEWKTKDGKTLKEIQDAEIME